MNEIQGPTPTGTARRYRSLEEALRAHRILPMNHEFIGDVMESVGIDGYIDRGRYIEAIRVDGRAALHIGKTYINGFEDGEELAIRGVRVSMQPSEGREPYHFVLQPSERPGAPRPSTRTAGARAPREQKAPRTPKPVERDYGTCNVCFMVRNASGKCGCDD